MAPQKVIVGLDINLNSIGWAALRSQDKVPTSVLAHGVWLFDSPLDPKTQVSLLRDRGIARRIRRNRDHKRLRMRDLRRLLVEARLLPDNDADLWKVLHEHVRHEGGQKVEVHPHALRARGLAEPLKPFEVGRVILHLAQRRGYLDVGDLPWLKVARSHPAAAGYIRERLKRGSNEAAQVEGKDKDAKEQKQLLAELGRVREQLAGQTPGQLLQAHLSQGRRVRSTSKKAPKSGHGFRLERWMLEDEFDRLWAFQAQSNPILTDDLCHRVKAIVFDQRPLKSASRLRGKCRLCPTHQPAAKASLAFQRFRIAQDVANLRILGPRGTQPAEGWLTTNRGLVYRSLNPEERVRLFDHLQDHRSLGATELKRMLGLAAGYKFAQEGNLGEDDPSKGWELKGNVTAVKVREAVGEDFWNGLRHPSEAEQAKGDSRGLRNQANLVLDLIEEPDENKLRRLMDFWDLRMEQALDLMRVRLPDGYGAYSSRAIRKIVPILLETGCDVLTASALAFPVRATEAPTKLGELSNHVVARCTKEALRVVEAIRQRFGEIEVVRIEVARDLARSPEERLEVEKEQKKNRTANEALSKVLREHGMKVTKENRLKLRLLYEQSEVFPVYGPPQPAPAVNQLDDCDIDHIIPRSRGGEVTRFDNLVLTTRQLNGAKASRTPFEAFGHDPDRWAAIERNARKLSGVDSADEDQETPGKKGKKGRLSEKSSRLLTRVKPEELTEETFADRALNDTRMVTKLVMKALTDQSLTVEPVPGRTTALLRTEFRYLGPFYKAVLPLSLVNPAQADETPESEEPDGEDKKADIRSKNRDFHYHHAIDALTIAMADRSCVRKILAWAREEERGGRRVSKEDVGWPKAIYDQLAAGPPPILFGCRRQNAMSGSWTLDGHEQILHNHERVDDKGKVTVKRRWDAAKYAEVTRSLREVLAEAEAAGKPYRRAAPVLDGEFLAFFEAGPDGPRPTQVLPKKSNHHLSVWKRTLPNGEAAFEVKVVSQLLVAHRRRLGLDPYGDRPTQGGEKLFDLHGGDVIELDEPGRFFVVRNISSAGRFELAASHISLSWIDKRSVKAYAIATKRPFERLISQDGRQATCMGRILRKVRLNVFGEAVG